MPRASIRHGSNMTAKEAKFIVVISRPRLMIIFMISSFYRMIWKNQIVSHAAIISFQTVADTVKYAHISLVQRKFFSHLSSQYLTITKFISIQYNYEHDWSSWLHLHSYHVFFTDSGTILLIAFILSCAIVNFIVINKCFKVIEIK